MPSVTSLKTTFQSQIAPGDDSEFLRILTEADIRLLEHGRWRWTRTKVVLTPVDGIITLPATYAAILGAQVGDYPSDIRAEEYEFAPDGIGDVQVGEGSTRLIDQGLNGDGLRTYKVSGYISDGTTITALVHYAPVTLTDPDIPDLDVPADAVENTRCPDVAALKLMCLGIIFEEAHDMAASRQYVSTALATLDNKEKTQRGNARQSMNIRPYGPGISKIRNLR